MTNISKIDKIKEYVHLTGFLKSNSLLKSEPLRSDILETAKNICLLASSVYGLHVPICIVSSSISANCRVRLPSATFIRIDLNYFDLAQALILLYGSKCDERVDAMSMYWLLNGIAEKFYTVGYPAESSIFCREAWRTVLDVGLEDSAPLRRTSRARLKAFISYVSFHEIAHIILKTDKEKLDIGYYDFRIDDILKRSCEKNFIHKAAKNYNNLLGAKFNLESICNSYEIAVREIIENKEKREEIYCDLFAIDLLFATAGEKLLPAEMANLANSLILFHLCANVGALMASLVSAYINTQGQMIHLPVMRTMRHPEQAARNALNHQFTIELAKKKLIDCLIDHMPLPAMGRFMDEWAESIQRLIDEFSRRLVIQLTHIELAMFYNKRFYDEIMDFHNDKMAEEKAAELCRLNFDNISELEMASVEVVFPQGP